MFIFSPNQNSIHWTWSTLSGPDAQDFLHRLTTVHVKRLELGQGRSGCFLNSQGKIRSYFTLWHFAPQEYAFEYDAGESNRWKSELFSWIDQYTFAEKITLTDTQENLDCRWIFPDEASLNQLQPGQTAAVSDEIRISHQGSQTFGRPWFTAWGRPARLAQWLEQSFPNSQSLTLASLEKWRIEAFQPRVDCEILDQVSPLEVGLAQSIAQNKGCYPGQEVIEKVISLGSPARRLVQIRGQGPAPKHGDAILNQASPPQTLGSITSSYSENENFTALGLIQKIHAKPELQVQFSNPQSQGVITQVAPYA